MGCDLYILRKGSHLGNPSGIWPIQKKNHVKLVFYLFDVKKNYAIDLIHSDYLL